MADTDLPPKKQSRTQLNESEFYDQIESPIIKDGWRGIIAEAKGMGLELLFAGKSVTLSARHPFNDAALTRLLSLTNADLVVGGRAKKGPDPTSEDDKGMKAILMSMAESMGELFGVACEKDRAKLASRLKAKDVLLKRDELLEILRQTVEQLDALR